MTVSKSLLVASFPLLAAASVALGELPCPGQPTAYFDCLESKGLGKFSGKVQSLLMHRDIDGKGDGSSGTVAVTLNYLSPDLNGFSLGAQYINGTRLFDSGSNDNAGYWLHNDDFNVVNEAYLAYDFGAIGLDWAKLKVGRQILNYDFAPTYNIRQKDQAFEAAVLQLEPIEGLRIDVGHLERFSSWSSRDGGSGSDWRANFIDVEDAMGVDYSANGVQFISAVYDGCAPWTFAAYDFYGEDLYNTFGAKTSYKWDLGPGAGSLTLRGHWANQQDVGRMDTPDGLGSINTNIYELGLDWARNGLTLSGGTVIVDGDRYQTPFRTSFTIDTELLWYTDQFVGETESVYLKGVYKTDKWLYYAMLVVDQHDSGTTCSEIDAVIKYTINDCMFTTIKAGYGGRDYRKKDDTDALDLRWFLGWTF